MEMIKEIRKDVSTYDEDLLKQFNIKAIENKTMRSLSGGTRQKISACLAFLFNPSIYILDEPTAGLDPVANELLKDKILEEKSKGKLILITSHVLSDLEGLISEIVYLQNGKVLVQDSVLNLEALTGEQKLNKVIRTIIENKINVPV